MSLMFYDFESWRSYCLKENLPLYIPVLDFEKEQKGHTEKEIWIGLREAFKVMKEAVETGLKEDTTSRSGMISNGGKKVWSNKTSVINPEFQQMLARTLAAKEVNSCMGKVVAAPTAGASGIMPGVLVSLQELHDIPDTKILESLLVSAGIALIIEQKASLAGAVGGCQAETGSAGAMASGAAVYCLGGTVDQVFNAVALTIQCTLGLVCDPVAGLVEVPCVVRNASAASIAFTSAQIALSDVDAVIPVDECVEAMGEIGQSMEDRYKETALGGLAATPTAKKISKKVLISDIEIISPDEEAQ